MKFLCFLRNISNIFRRKLSMKNLNRWVYAIIGVITLLLAGLVYAWSVMSKSIGASRPDWTAAQLSMTFTMVMAFFCIGCLIAGMMAKKSQSEDLHHSFRNFISGRIYDRFHHRHFTGYPVSWIRCFVWSWRRILS